MCFAQSRSGTSYSRIGTEPETHCTRSTAFYTTVSGIVSPAHGTWASVTVSCGSSALGPYLVGDGSKLTSPQVGPTLGLSGSPAGPASSARGEGASAVLSDVTVTSWIASPQWLCGCRHGLCPGLSVETVIYPQAAA